MTTYRDAGPGSDGSAAAVAGTVFEDEAPEVARTYAEALLNAASTQGDDHVEAVLAEQKVFPQKSNLVQKKRVAKALLEGLEGLDPLDVHHLLVEYGKKDLKKKPEPSAAKA